MKNKICWVCEEQDAVTTHEGHPICDSCLDHFLGFDDIDGMNRRAERRAEQGYSE